MQKTTSHLTPCFNPPKLLAHRGDRHLVGERRACDSQLDPIVRRWRVASCSPSAQGPALTRRHTPACCLPFPPVMVEIPSATKVMRHLIGLERPPNPPPPHEDCDPCPLPSRSASPGALARHWSAVLCAVRVAPGEGELDGRAVAHLPLYRN
ncbi:hypothetical protein CGRA01v4_14939 [Colletotrichum graminicola]|nr:hypothetical protein CGRA01v4_14939 [Colletotrichum graminicola]